MRFAAYAGVSLLCLNGYTCRSPILINGDGTRADLYGSGHRRCYPCFTPASEFLFGMRLPRPEQCLPHGKYNMCLPSEGLLLIYLRS